MALLAELESLLDAHGRRFATELQHTCQKADLNAREKSSCASLYLHARYCSSQPKGADVCIHRAVTRDTT
jgi:hypothetical protein